jgi:type III secretory pathway component EscV
MAFPNSSYFASALVAGLIAMPAMALAQTTDPETPPAAQEQTEQQQDQQTEGQAEEQAEEQDEEQTAATKPTDEQLESFAAATIDIVQIQEAAQKQMQAAVEEAGLTIEEYNGIAKAAQSDPDIDQALQQLIQDRLGG